MQLLATCDGGICNMLFRPQDDDPKLSGPDWSVKFQVRGLEIIPILSTYKYHYRPISRFKAGS